MAESDLHHPVLTRCVAAAGFRHALAWVLPACAALGVVLQARKVDTFCRHKYGAAWERYEARVRYSLVPSVF